MAWLSLPRSEGHRSRVVGLAVVIGLTAAEWLYRGGIEGVFIDSHFDTLASARSSG